MERGMSEIDADNLLHYIEDHDMSEQENYDYVAEHMDIDNYIAQVQLISDELCAKNSENSEIYKKNTAKYIQQLEKLKNEMDNIEIKDTQIISFNEAFEYLFDYLKIDVIEIESEGEESNMSARSLADVIDSAKEQNIESIFLDKKDNIRDAKIISNETNAKIHYLNSGLYGEFDKNSYVNQMEENIKIIEEIVKK